MLSRYSTWLGIIERKYAVQGRSLVALWETETDYGRSTGRFPVIHSWLHSDSDGRINLWESMPDAPPLNRRRDFSRSDRNFLTQKNFDPPFKRVSVGHAAYV